MATEGRRRALGQHFLKDQSVSQAIAHAALEEVRQYSCPTLIEVGPGRGAISFPLLEEMRRNPGSLKRFLMIEKDPHLVKQDWMAKLPSDTEVKISVELGDFLELPEATWLENPGPLAIVSNLPYSAGTAILNRLARKTEHIAVMTLMFQAEVAKRLRAEPSTKERGSLSLWIQNHWDVRKLLSVPPSAFSPPPQVHSEVVILVRRQHPQIALTANSPKDEELWESLLKMCFAHRRKMLRSVVSYQNALELSGVDGTKRAEALQWNEWNDLFKAVRKIVNSPSS